MLEICCICKSLCDCNIKPIISGNKCTFNPDTHHSAEEYPFDLTLLMVLFKRDVWEFVCLAVSISIENVWTKPDFLVGHPHLTVGQRSLPLQTQSRCSYGEFLQQKTSPSLAIPFCPSVSTVAHAPCWWCGLRRRTGFSRGACGSSVPSEHPGPLRSSYSWTTPARPRRPLPWIPQMRLFFWM